MKIQPMMVKIDETADFNDPELVGAAGKIEGIYLYDSSVVTYCCSLEPSYSLEMLDYTTLNLLPDEMYDRLRECLSSDAGYYSAYMIDSLQPQPLPLPVINGTYELDTWEEIVEYYRANPPC